jgi:SecD/SecF fusion protein
MKTIYYFIITILICLTLTSASQKTPENQNSIILQATNSKVSSQLLTQSARIITDRLKTYGLETTISIISDKGQIKVQLPGDVKVSEIEGLLTTKGNLGFYETLTLKEIGDLLKTRNRQDLLKTGTATSLSDAKLGCSAFENQGIADTIVNCLKSINLSSDYKLLWGFSNSKSMKCLYALKTSHTGTTPLGGSDIETIESSQDNNSKTVAIYIKFKPAAVKIWAIETKNNLGKPIAIVIDDKVFYTPVVKTSMESGLCEITGNFILKDVNYFLALVNNGPLPANFYLK